MTMTNTTRLAAAIILTGVSNWACSSPKPAAPPASAAPVMTPVVSVKELMRFDIDPVADKVRYYRLCEKDVAAIQFDGPGTLTADRDYEVI